MFLTLWALMERTSKSLLLAASQVLNLCFCTLRKKFNSHHFSYVNNWGDRKTTTEVNRCPLLPGGLGQLVVQAFGLDEGQPYLLLWAFHSVVDGGQPVQVREVLACLGFVPSFRSGVHPQQGV